jgi:hypothetical protein
MKKHHIIFLSLLLPFLYCPSAVFAESGNEFLVTCNEGIRVMDSDFTTGDANAAVHCFAVIQAVRDTSAIYKVTLDEIGLNDHSSNACVPDSVSVGQLARVVVKYLNANPEVLHLEETGLVWLAILDAYACYKS